MKLTNSQRKAISAISYVASIGNASTCRSCHAPIVWVVTVKGKRTPLNLGDPPTPHFMTCPNADKWRRKP